MGARILKMKSRELTSEGVRGEGQIEKSFAVSRDDAKDTYPARYISTNYIKSSWFARAFMNYDPDVYRVIVFKMFLLLPLPIGLIYWLVYFLPFSIQGLVPCITPKNMTPETLQFDKIQSILSSTGD